MAPCAINDAVLISPEMSKASMDEEDLSSRVHEMAEVVAGYVECMQEAVRYLVEEESYPECHPAVQGLRQHLADYQRQLLQQALQTCQRTLS